MATSYALGKTFQLGVTCVANSVVADPSVLSLKILSPVGNVTTTYTLAEGHFTKTSTGVYYINLRLTEAGTWYYRWETNTEASDDQTLVIKASTFYSDNVM